MPMIDVYAVAGTSGDPRALAQKLASELMAIEQVPDIPMFRQNTAAFIHDLPPGNSRWPDHRSMIEPSGAVEPLG